MVRGLLRCHATGPDFLFDERVVIGLAAQLAVRRDAVEARVADVADGGAQAVEVERDDCGRHHGEARLLARHTVDRVVGALDGDLHKVFDVLAGVVLAERLGENFDGGLRRDLARLRAAHAVCDGEDAVLRVVEHRVFVERSLLAQAAIRYGRRLYGQGRGVFCH